MPLKRERLCLALCLTCGLAVSGVRAAEGGSEQEFLGEVPIVLTASRLRQSATDVPISLTVIDHATIEASGLRGIADVMRLVPGMYVGHGHGIEGVVPVVSYHGLTDEFSRRMLVLVDGRSVNTPMFGTVLWDDLPIAIDDIERIEITRGPNAASYGANAFFGVINIITRAAVMGEGLYALARAGQDGVRDGVLRYANESGPVSYRATVGHKADDGFVNVYDEQHHSYATLRADVDVGSRDSLQTQLGYSEGERQQGFYSSPVARPRTKSIDDEYAQLKWQHWFSQSNELAVQGYFSHNNTEESVRTLPLPLPGLPLQSYDLKSTYYLSRRDLELQQTIGASPDLRLILGAALREDDIYSPLYFARQPGQASSLKRLFFHAEWRAAAQWLLQAGGMAEKTSIAGIDLSPRICATYLIDAEHSLRASVSKAMRTPLLSEEHVDYGLDFGPFRDQIALASGGVRSERLISRELGYHAALLGGAAQIDVKLYSDRASQLIDNAVVPSASNLLGFYTDPQNMYDVTVRGLEGEVHYHVGDRTRVVLAWAYTAISAPADHPEIGLTAPRQTLAVLLEQRLGAAWSATAALYENGRLQPEGGQGAVLSARRLDLRLTRTLLEVDRRARASVGAQSVLAPYQDFRPDNVFTRRAYAEVSFGL